MIDIVIDVFFLLDLMYEDKSFYKMIEPGTKIIRSLRPQYQNSYIVLHFFRIFR